MLVIQLLSPPDTYTANCAIIVNRNEKKNALARLSHIPLLHRERRSLIVYTVAIRCKEMGRLLSKHDDLNCAHGTAKVA